MFYWVLLLLHCHDVWGVLPSLSWRDNKSAVILSNLITDIIHDTDERVSVMELVKQDSHQTPQFEVGYLTHILQEKYRKMVDKYKTCTEMRIKLYVIELVIYLEEIERHYWQIEHISNMLHEVERKYRVTSGLHEKFHPSHVVEPTLQPTVPTPHRREKPERFKVDKYLQHYVSDSTTKKRASWWPIEYGWDIDYYW